MVKEPIDKAVTNLSKIHLRLNPDKCRNHPESDEAKLLVTIQNSRDLIKEGNYNEAIDSCPAIRDAAAPILKTTWVTIRDGESGYMKIKKISSILIILGTFILLGYVILACFLYSTNLSFATTPPNININL